MKHVRIPPGETVLFGGQLPPGVDPRLVTLQARWRCGACDHMLCKGVPMLDANRSRISLACPYCDPQNLDSYGVTTLAAPRNRLRRWLSR